MTKCLLVQYCKQAEATGVVYCEDSNEAHSVAKSHCSSKKPCPYIIEPCPDVIANFVEGHEAMAEMKHMASEGMKAN